jgi:hypothetical protein
MEILAVKRVIQRMSAGLAAIALLAQPLAAADRLEPGLQGQTAPGDIPGAVLAAPYSKGVRVVGHNNLGDRGSNLQLAWVDHCAYVSSTIPEMNLAGFEANPAATQASKGVAVLDVSNPRNPRQVGLLRGRGAIYATETMHAVSAPGRKVLAAGSYGGGKPGSSADNAAFLDLYDVSDCAHPKHMSEFIWPENVHMVTVSPNGKRVYGTIIEPFGGTGGLFVLDISDLAKPRLIGKFPATRADGTSFQFAAHEVTLSPDERRIYAGVLAAGDGELKRRAGAPFPSAETMGPESGGLLIFDNSDIVDGRPDPKLRLMGTAPHAGWHSPARASFGGKPYIVNASELGACPGTWPRFTDISDESNPRVTGEFRLAMNHKENCPAWTAMETATRGVVGAPGTAASHFNDVDSPTDTRLGLFNFLAAGLRVVDLRDPAKPVEVAYFKPGDSCVSHVRYYGRTGHIWVVCNRSGFFVLDLDPKLRRALKLPKRR